MLFSFSGGVGVGVQGKSGGGGGHKGRWDPTDDGSEAQAVDGIADKGDPNYDSEADDHDNNYVLVCMPALCCFLRGTERVLRCVCSLLPWLFVFFFSRG